MGKIEQISKLHETIVRLESQMEVCQQEARRAWAQVTTDQAIIEQQRRERISLSNRLQCLDKAFQQLQTLFRALEVARDWWWAGAMRASSPVEENEDHLLYSEDIMGGGTHVEGAADRRPEL